MIEKGFVTLDEWYEELQELRKKREEVLAQLGPSLLKRNQLKAEHKSSYSMCFEGAKGPVEARKAKANALVSEIYKELMEEEAKTTALELMFQRLNSDISTIQTLINAARKDPGF